MPALRPTGRNFFVNEPPRAAAEQVVEQVFLSSKVGHERLAARRAVIEVRAEADGGRLIDETRLVRLRFFRAHAAAAFQDHLAGSVKYQVSELQRQPGVQAEQSPVARDRDG